MGTRILGIAGHKQSGKSTLSNFIHGYQLRAHHTIDGFKITQQGELVVDTALIDSEGNETQGQGIIDPKRQDVEFAEWAAYSMWPFVKSYSFASTLKEIAIGLFGIKHEQVYGGEGQKNSYTWFKWEDMPGIVTKKSLLTKAGIKTLIADGTLQFHKPGKMTAREFLQFFGTDICRKIYSEIWQVKIINDITREGSLLAIVDDCRFPNEVESIQNAGGKVIYLQRNIHSDTHSSECSLDNYESFDAIIDNSNMTIHETSIAIIEQFDKWGWLGKEIATTSEPNKEVFSGIHTIKEKD